MNTQAEAILKDKPTSVGALLNWRAEQTPHSEAFRYPDAGDVWQSLTWSQTKQRIHEIAAGLLTLGVGQEERVAIAAQTRIEWILADLAIMASGAATTTIYPNTAPDDFQYIIGHSASQVLIADNAAQAAKLEGGDHQVRAVVLFDGEGDGERILSWHQLIERGRRLLADDPTCVDAANEGIGLDNLATLIYTSGTTGRPKGVELVHRNWIYEGFSVERLNLIDFTDLQYLWLPLSHVFGKCLVAIQVAIGFASAVDGRQDRIVANLAATQPTFMCGPPRIYEKVRATVLTSNSTGVKGAIARWAFGVGKDSHPFRLAGQPLPRLLSGILLPQLFPLLLPPPWIVLRRCRFLFRFGRLFSHWRASFRNRLPPRLQAPLIEQVEPVPEREKHHAFQCEAAEVAEPVRKQHSKGHWRRPVQQEFRRTMNK